MTPLEGKFDTMGDQPPGTPCTQPATDHPTMGGKISTLRGKIATSHAPGHPLAAQSPGCPGIRRTALAARWGRKNTIGERKNTIGEKINTIGEKINTIGEKINTMGEKTNTIVGEKINTVGEKKNTTGEKNNTMGEKINTVGERKNTMGEKN